MPQTIIYLFSAILIVLIALPSDALARENKVIIHVTDTAGNPVSDVVVALLPEKPISSLEPMPMATMAQKEMTFMPHILAITAGSVVKFPNLDTFRHHIYSFSKAQPFEIRLYGGDEEKQVTFDTAGVVALGCNIHDDMLAYIYVANTPYVAKTDAEGRIEFSAISKGKYSTELWHPRLKKQSNGALQSFSIEAGGTIEQTFSITLKRAKKKGRKKRY